jgi:hypothetical protein
MSERNKPVLIPRTLKEGETTRRIEVWHVDGVLPDGKVAVHGQQREEVEGDFNYPGKPVSPELLSDEIQGKLAEELASGRQYNREVTDRGVDASKVGGEVLAAVDIQPVRENSEVADSHEGAPFDIERTFAMMDEVTMNYYTRHEGAPRTMGLRLSIFIDQLKEADIDGRLDRTDLEVLSKIVDKWKSITSLDFPDKSLSDARRLINQLHLQYKKQ